MRPRRAIAMTLCLLHALLLAEGLRLHEHAHAGELAAVALPAEYHDHDYGWTSALGQRSLTVHDCLGCRLERTPTLPPPGAARLDSPAKLYRGSSAPPAFPAMAPPRALLPRGPPRA